MASTPYTVVLNKRSDHDNFGVYIGEDVLSGLYIVTIEPNSPAADANIQPGDRVLAVNGQLVSSMSMNPKEMIVQIANTAQSLTLSIRSSNVLEFINTWLSNGSYNDNYRYTTKSSESDDHDFENYIRSIFLDESLHIIPSSSNNNEYILTSDQYSVRPRHHRKRRHYKTKETQTLTNDEQKENIQTLLRHRSIPSMGTSHAILRNSQLSSKDNGINESQEVKSLPNIQPTINNRDFGNNEIANASSQPIPLSNRPSEPSSQVANNRDFGIKEIANPSSQPISLSNRPSEPSSQLANNRDFDTNEIANRSSKTISVSNQLVNSSSYLSNNQVNIHETPQSSLTVNNRPPSINAEGLREVYLRRSSNFSGYGFHLQYNNVYYIIKHVEPNSPAQHGDLRKNDVIHKINNQRTENMPHINFVQLIDSSTEAILLVQTFNDYLRFNPQAIRNQTTEPTINTTVNNNKNDSNRHKNVLSKALTKIRGR